MQPTLRLGVLVIVAAVLATASCGTGPSGDDTVSGPERLVESPNLYGMDIEAAGQAHIPNASLDGGELTIAYQYDATDGSDEQRTGSMTLRVDDNTNAAGNWRTVADNGTVYNGPLEFTFAADGSAQGTYQFNATTYNVTIYLLG